MPRDKRTGPPEDVLQRLIVPGSDDPEPSKMSASIVSVTPS